MTLATQFEQIAATSENLTKDLTGIVSEYYAANSVFKTLNATVTAVNFQDLVSVDDAPNTKVPTTVRAIIGADRNGFKLFPTADLTGFYKFSFPTITVVGPESFKEGMEMMIKSESEALTKILAESGLENTTLELRILSPMSPFLSKEGEALLMQAFYFGVILVS